METSSIVFGSTRIDYAIRRTARIKTVSIAVDPEDGVVIAAPRGVEVERIAGIVRGKARWILTNLKHASDRPPPMTPRELVSGESYLYAGRQHRLRVIAAQDAPEGTALERGFLVVRARAEQRTKRGAPSFDPERVRALLVEWYRRRAAERLGMLVEAWSERTGCRPTKVSIVEPRRRWGSCTASGELRLNWRVVGLSKRVAEYVVAHELVHLRHPDHTPAFWRALAQAMADYEERRAQLRAIGPRLVW